MPSKSATYYRTHPKARAKKKKYDTKLNARPAQVKKRVQSNRKRAQAKRRGTNIRGLDWDHAIGRFIKSSVNRGRRGEGNR